MTNTALSAMSSEITQKVTFSGQKHKDFYLEYEAYGANVRIFDISIPRLEPIAETASMGYSTFEYKKAGKGAECYLQVAKEVLNHA